MNRLLDTLAGVAIATVGGFAVFMMLTVFFGSGNKVKVDTSPAPAMATWVLPSCPRELTLQDGSRWAPPWWSDPGCKASIIYTVPK